MPESDAQSEGYIQEESAGKRCSECGVYSGGRCRKAMLRVWGIFRRKVSESDAQSVGYIQEEGAGKRCSECGVYSAF